VAESAPAANGLSALSEKRVAAESEA
jgi:hypothetical protein